MGLIRQQIASFAFWTMASMAMIASGGCGGVRFHERPSSGPIPVEPSCGVDAPEAIPKNHERKKLFNKRPKSEGSHFQPFQSSPQPRFHPVPTRPVFSRPTISEAASPPSPDLDVIAPAQGS